MGTFSGWEYAGTMPGQLCSKSNSRRVVRQGSKIRVIKSEESLSYVDGFVRLFREQKAFEGDVVLEVHAYYKDRRRDLDIALLQDALQKANVIKNDRQVVEIHAYRYIDKKNPRTGFFLKELRS